SVTVSSRWTPSGSLVSSTVCVPGGSESPSSGVSPRGLPSTRTCAHGEALTSSSAGSSGARGGAACAGSTWRDDGRAGVCVAGFGDGDGGSVGGGGATTTGGGGGAATVAVCVGDGRWRAARTKKIATPP